MNIEYNQLGILLFGCSAIWVLGRPESWRGYGYVLGLVSQPFWLYMSVKAHQWGVVILTVLYTYGWIQGVWFHWFKARLVQPEKTIVPNRI
jgi:hypothetical protein